MDLLHKRISELENELKTSNAALQKSQGELLRSKIASVQSLKSDQMSDSANQKKIELLILSLDEQKKQNQDLKKQCAIAEAAMRQAQQEQLSMSSRQEINQEPHHRVELNIELQMYQQKCHQLEKEVQLLEAALVQQQQQQQPLSDNNASSNINNNINNNNKVKELEIALTLSQERCRSLEVELQHAEMAVKEISSEWVTHKTSTSNTADQQHQQQQQTEALLIAELANLEQERLRCCRERDTAVAAMKISQEELVQLQAEITAIRNEQQQQAARLEHSSTAALSQQVGLTEELEIQQAALHQSQKVVINLQMELQRVREMSRASQETTEHRLGVERAINDQLRERHEKLVKEHQEVLVALQRKRLEESNEEASLMNRVHQDQISIVAMEKAKVLTQYAASATELRSLQKENAMLEAALALSREREMEALKKADRMEKDVKLNNERCNTTINLTESAVKTAMGEVQLAQQEANRLQLHLHEMHLKCELAASNLAHYSTCITSLEEKIRAVVESSETDMGQVRNQNDLEAQRAQAMSMEIGMRASQEQQHQLQCIGQIAALMQEIQVCQSAAMNLTQREMTNRQHCEQMGRELARMCVLVFEKTKERHENDQGLQRRVLDFQSMLAENEKRIVQLSCLIQQQQQVIVELRDELQDRCKKIDSYRGALEELRLELERRDAALVAARDDRALLDEDRMQLSENLAVTANQLTLLTSQHQDLQQAYQSLKETEAAQTELLANLGMALTCELNE